MSVSSEKKLKQALLQFKTTSNEKKRKLDDDTNFDEVKCRKLSLDNLGRQNQQPVDNKKDLLNGDLLTNDDASIMVVDSIDLCEDSSHSGDENSCPLADTSLTNVSLPCSQETPKRKTSEAHSKSDSNSPNSIIKSVENSAQKVLSNSITPRKPKESKEERERLKQEKERLKQEREKERLAKLEAKEEEKRQKEEERKAKEEEKRQKAQAKEEERKAKEEEKRQKAQAKEEERRQKEEERKAKEEEKRQKDEEKRNREEEKRQREELEKKSKEKSAALFTNFFLKCNKNAPTKSQPAESSEKIISTKFMPFEVKDNMRLASIQRVVLTPEKLRYLDEISSHDSNMSIDSLYLAQLRSKNYVRGHSENTWPSNANEDDDDVKEDTAAAPRYRCKLLQFRENRRPAYWGTWRKRSKTINGRRPFKLDTSHFEYEIDSDDEWVDEEPGESLGGSEDDLESEDDYEVDNDMFVPHGYLSDEEGQPDEVPEEISDSPKSHKRKLNILEKQFEDEMKEKTSKLKPRVYGCIWIPNDVEKNGKDNIENMLLTYRAVWNEDRAPFHVNLDVENSTPTMTPSSKSKTTPQTGVLKEFPDSLVADLIKLVHGNKFSGQKLVDEFKLYALSVDSTLNLTKSCLFNKIREIASWIPNLACWMVNDDVRQQHNLADLSPAENTWKYISNFEAASSKKSQNVAASGAEKAQTAAPLAMVTTPTSSGNPKKVSSITKFIRVYKASEKGKQPAESTAEPEKK